MRRLTLAVLLLPLPSFAADRPLGMAEAYKLALARSEEIAISGATYEETVARAEEIFSRALPRLSLMGTETFQDVPRGQSGLFLQRQREQGWLNVQQPLFSGFREFLAHRASKHQGRAAELRLERAKHLLYQDVARAYLDLAGAQDDIRIRSSLLVITEDRVKDLREFRRLGRARASEHLAAESQAAQIRAQLESAKAVEQVAQFRLGFLTGLDERLAPEAVPAPASAPALDAVLSRARGRADVESMRAEQRAADDSIKVVTRRRWPSISADANYYLKRPPSFTQDVKWDATITGSLPLWGGGEIDAQSRQAKARAKAQDAALSQALRTAELEARSAHQQLLSSEAVVSALNAAEKLAAQNAGAQSDDYRLGQVTNLDVLGGLNVLQQTRLSLNAARVDAYWSRVRLEVAAGVPGGSL